MRRDRSSIAKARQAEARLYWEGKACGSRHTAAPSHSVRFFEEADRFRYGIEPVESLARFQQSGGLRILEIGSGMGGDLARFLGAGANAVGIDLSSAAVEATAARLILWSLPLRVARADALSLPFRTGAFDVVWSWGVLHHTGDIDAAVAEAHRVLKPGGEIRLMLYHRPSWVALAAWIRWGVIAGRPFQGLRTVVERHVESPGTQALTLTEIRSLLREFRDVDLRVLGTYWDRRFAPLLGRLAGGHLGWFALVRAWKRQPSLTDPGSELRRGPLS